MGKSKSRFPPFRQIEQLKCFPKVKELLLSGRPARRVAKTIQEEFGEMRDHEYASLVAYLLAYRRTLSAVELAKATQPQFVSEAMDTISQGLDELQELAEIFAIQKERIVQGHELEKNLKVLNRTLGNEVRIAAELLRTSHQIKADVGFNSAGGRDSVRMNPAIAYDIQSRFGEKVARVMADPAKRTRVLEAAKRALDKGAATEDQEVVPLRRASGG